MRHTHPLSGLAALSLTALAAVTTGAATASADDPYVTPVRSRMPTFSAAVMSGSTLHRDGTRIETGIEGVGTYVNLRGDLLVATTRGRLVSWRDGDVDAVGLFRRRNGVRLVADRTARYAAIVKGTCDAGRQRIRVYDKRADRVILKKRVRMTECSRLRLDTEAVYYVNGDRLMRLDLDDATLREVPVDGAGSFADAVAEHVVLFEPGGAYVRPVDDLSSGGRLSLAADYVSPNLHWSAALEQGLTIDNTTRKPVRPAMRVPKSKKYRVDVHGWVGPDTIAYAAQRRGGARVALYECDATQSTCERVVNVPARRLVEPGLWYPSSE